MTLLQQRAKRRRRKQKNPPNKEILVHNESIPVYQMLDNLCPTLALSEIFHWQRMVCTAACERNRNVYGANPISDPSPRIG